MRGALTRRRAPPPLLLLMPEVWSVGDDISGSDAVLGVRVQQFVSVWQVGMKSGEVIDLKGSYLRALVGTDKVRYSRVLWSG